MMGLSEIVSEIGRVTKHLGVFMDVEKKNRAKKP